MRSRLSPGFAGVARKRARAESGSASSSRAARSLESNSSRRRSGPGKEGERAEIPWLRSPAHPGCGKQQRRRPPDPREMLQWKGRSLTRREQLQRQQRQQRQPTPYEAVCQQRISANPASPRSLRIVPKQQQRAGGNLRRPSLWVAKTTAAAAAAAALWRQHGLSC